MKVCPSDCCCQGINCQACGLSHQHQIMKLFALEKEQKQVNVTLYILWGTGRWTFPTHVVQCSLTTQTTGLSVATNTTYGITAHPTSTPTADNCYPFADMNASELLPRQSISLRRWGIVEGKTSKTDPVKNIPTSSSWTQIDKTLICSQIPKTCWLAGLLGTKKCPHFVGER